MKKIAVVLSLGLLLFVLSYGGWGIGQVEEPKKEFPLKGEKLVTVSIQEEIAQLTKETELLMLINLMELTKDQMTQLKDITSALLGIQKEIRTAQEELKDFLLGFQGSREEFQKAVAPFGEKLKGAREAFQAKTEDSLSQIKSILTIKQGEVLIGFLTQSEQVLVGEEEIVDVDKVIPEKLGFEFWSCPPKEAEKLGLEKAPKEEVLQKAEPVAPMVTAQLKVRKFLLTNLELLVNLLQEKLKRLGVE